MRRLPVFNHPGLAVLVSDEDFPALSRHRWTMNKGYARRWAGGGYVQIAWDVARRMGMTGTEFDHIDRDPLNNQRSNLRPSTRSANNSNRRFTVRFLKAYVSPS